MLALLSRGAARILDVRLETAEGLSPSPEDEEAFSIDVDALSALLPTTDFSWRRITRVYGETISPMYKSMHNILMEDAEHVVRLLSELEPLEDDQNDDSEAAIAVPCPQYPLSPDTLPSHECPLPIDRSSLPNRHRNRRRPSSPSDHPVLIPSTHPSTPSIIITPCAPSRWSASSRIPLQDASFGNKLAVPGYPHFNSCFAPLILKPGHVPLVECWKWKEGHWWAIVPDLEVQRRKGWFSRPVSARRRAARPCRAWSIPGES